MKINNSWGSTKSTASQVLENAACLSKISCPAGEKKWSATNVALHRWFQRLRELGTFEGLLVATENVVAGLHGVIDGKLHVFLAGKRGFEFRSDGLAD